MAKTKISKAKGLELIRLEILRGTTYTSLLRVFAKRYDISNATFTNWWSSVSKEIVEENKQIKSELYNLRLEEEKRALKGAILDKNKALELLSKIATSEDEEIKTSDKIKAIQEVCKLQNFYNNEINVSFAERPLFFDEDMLKTEEQKRIFIDLLEENY